jgi:hypothetical protein
MKIQPIKVSRILLLLLLILFITSPIQTTCFGQQIRTINFPFLLSSSGNIMQNEEFGLDWSLGEIAIETIGNDSHLLTQGFHQPSFSLTSSYASKIADIDILVYPNPTNRNLNVKLSLDAYDTLKLSLLDVSGKLLLNREYHGQVFNESLALENLSAGVYFLKIYTSSLKVHQTCLIQKIN